MPITTPKSKRVHAIATIALLITIPTSILTHAGPLPEEPPAECTLYLSGPQPDPITEKNLPWLEDTNICRWMIQQGNIVWDEAIGHDDYVNDQSAVDLALATLQPGDINEMILQALIANVPSCIGIPTERIHLDLGPILFHESSCHNRGDFLALYDNVTQRVINATQNITDPDYATIKDEVLNALEELTQPQAQSTQQKRGHVDDCDRPSLASQYDRDTPITITIYWDKNLNAKWEDNWGRYPTRMDQATMFMDYLHAKTNGNYKAHATKPDVTYCLAWLGEVPQVTFQRPDQSWTSLDGDIGQAVELQDIGWFENRFNNPSDIVVVMGRGEIRPDSGGWHKGLTQGDSIAGTVGRGGSPAATYFQFYAYGTKFAGVRIGVHEMGHAMSLDHNTICDDGPHKSWKDWLHFMGLSKDANSSCKWKSVTHVHYNFHRIDSQKFSNEHVKWCRQQNPNC